ncbi:hypothetical protein DYH09_07190 [bacterium CPR1]|nr:hypothetical protein [bacterium CPR1]
MNRGNALLALLIVAVALGLAWFRWHGSRGPRDVYLDRAYSVNCTILGPHYSITLMEKAPGAETTYRIHSRLSSQSSYHSDGTVTRLGVVPGIEGALTGPEMADLMGYLRESGMLQQVDLVVPGSTRPITEGFFDIRCGPTALKRTFPLQRLDELLRNAPHLGPHVQAMDRAIQAELARPEVRKLQERSHPSEAPP